MAFQDKLNHETTQCPNDRSDRLDPKVYTEHGSPCVGMLASVLRAFCKVEARGWGGRVLGLQLKKPYFFPYWVRMEVPSHCESQPRPGPQFLQLPT